MSGITPTEEELKNKASSLRELNPTLGINKLLLQLKLDEPNWIVSEKRFKKYITPSINTTSTNLNDDNNEIDELIAKTGIDNSIEISKIAPKVKVKMFNLNGKGKGLIAKEKLQKGELLWHEEPWIGTSDPSLWPFLEDNDMCTSCLTLFQQKNQPLSIKCKFCKQINFCNRLCYKKSIEENSTHNDFLCIEQNSNSKSILNFIKQKKSRDLQGVIRIISKWRKEREFGDLNKSIEIQNRIWNSMARINQKLKEEERKEWPFIAKDRMEEWRLTHLLILNALNPSPKDEGYKSFQKFLNSKKRNESKPITKEEEERWFSFESFLELLGLIGLNQESSGGLYILHSHLNHSCDPNLQVRNLPKNWIAPNELPAELPPPMTTQNRGTNRISIIVKKEIIHKGEELTISYVDQRLSRNERRIKLREQYGFWCFCQRCIKEKKEEDKEKEKEKLNDN
ncbi:uncharacterized protein I206_101119 [Kwoniella pini CBS 10737]|uniref:Histone-lysine N-methyltransferase SET5 n=1 Tax=Kwoniella pini CBS 10737 TaxID=1296096 RepID=A0A1B9IBI9_9TREE|nr:uncharacterized protein I206_00207 [Kwoniella pini CBS 10737]OCF52906.1 hypothetical protein I206_00207 [Kwoniella pini CBS 10737]